ncbi:MAG: peptidylprolyl isomerase [Candidatus Krumholzibacteriales bacterium]
MNKFKRIARLAFACAVLLAAAAPGKGARGGNGGREVIDRVIAVVEDNAVLQSEYDMELKRILMQMGEEAGVGDSVINQVKEEVLNGLVADMLMAVHAERTGVEVDQSVIDEEVEKTIERNITQIGGREAFQEELNRYGLTEEQIRRQWEEKIRARRLMQQLAYSEIWDGIDISEDELREYYREKKDEFPPRPPTVTLAQILICPEASGEGKAAALEKIKAVEKELKSGVKFEELAREYSEGPSAEAGGNLGFVNLEDFNNQAFEDAVRELDPGQVSGPVLTNFGYHLIKLEEKREGQHHVRHILIRVTEDSAQLDAAREKAGELVKRAEAGEAFAKLAAEYSCDEETAGSGGLLGEVPISRLPEQFREAVRGVEPGDIAPLVRDSKGIRIIKVIDFKSEGEYSFEEAREELKRILTQEKVQQKYTEYVNELKEKYYVEIKEDVLQ